MRFKAFFCAFAVTLGATMSASAAVSFTGNYASNLKDSTGTTNIPVGTRYIVVVDTAGNGFGGSTNGSIAGGTTLNVGDSFGGDEIIQSSTIPTLAGRAATGVSNQPLDSAPYAGKQFAIYWFESETGTTAVNGDDYGFFRDAGWIVPSSPGTYSFAASGGDFVQNTANQSASLTVGAAPEPSRAILLGFGALGFMMRRRRK